MFKYFQHNICVFSSYFIHKIYIYPSDSLNAALLLLPPRLGSHTSILIAGQHFFFFAWSYRPLVVGGRYFNCLTILGDYWSKMPPSLSWPMAPVGWSSGTQAPPPSRLAGAHAHTHFCEAVRGVCHKAVHSKRRRGPRCVEDGTERGKKGGDIFNPPPSSTNTVLALQTRGERLLER